MLTGKTYDALKRQLKIEGFKNDAIDCIRIFEKLDEINGGRVWSSDWESLVTTHWIGNFPNSTPIVKPTALGYLILRGIKET